MDIRNSVARACADLSSNDTGFTTLDLRLEDNQPLNQAESNALIAALSVNTRVEYLSLYGNFETAPEFIRFFVETFIINHPSLHQFILGGRGITDDHASLAAEAIKRNPRLKKIGLTASDIGANGARALAEGLCHNISGLERFVLSHMNIGLDGCQAFASALGDSGLKLLGLVDCGIAGNEGAIVIADELCKNKTLLCLNLHDNDLADEGCRSIAMALPHNCSLLQLVLSQNQVTDAGAAAIEASLQCTNYTIELVELQENEGVTEEQRNRINHLCDNNRLIKRAFGHLKNELHVLPLGLFPEALELVKDKPDLLYQVLKLQPLLFRERKIQRKRKRPLWLRY